MFKPKSPHIKQVISKNSSLCTLINHTKHLVKLNRIVQRQLTYSLQPHCKVANYRENTLYLHVDSAAWATRLRFNIPQLTEQLKKTKEFKELQSIRIHQGKQPINKENKQKPINIRLSKDTAEQLNCLADNVTDEKLASALKRLAKRTG